MSSATSSQPPDFPSFPPRPERVTPERVTVVLVDDHTVVREGLKLLLKSQPDMDVIGECADGATAAAIVADLAPRIIILDLSMRGMHGIAASQRIKQASPKSRIIAFTVHEEPDLVREMLAAGATGYVLKRSNPDELLTAIRTVAAGETYIDPQVTAAAGTAALTRGPRSAFSSAPQPTTPLSNRETEVIRLLAAGHTNKDIAESLGVSVKTVETYKARVMSKLHLERRVDIVKYAARQGWLMDL
jgi:two-component system, NarL family, response regulator NreC